MNADGMNFYKHHLGDYDGHTAHLSWDEDMAYTRLIRVYYRRESPIPHAERYRLSRASTKAQKAAVDAVLAEFFRNDGDVWRQKRCDEEIETYKAKADANRENGPKGGRPKTHKEPKNNPDGFQKETHEEPTNNLSQNQIPEPEPEKAKPFASPDKSGSAINGEAVAYIPLNNGSDWGVSKGFLAELEKAYPVVDGPKTLQEIRVWCLANPAKRKTKTGVARFVNNWFAREQDGPQNRR
jgi:uncharacterized protein YdaU (DUF1376 family)